MKYATQILVSYKADTKLLDNKWVFKVMRNSYGTIQIYKFQLVAKDFQ